MSVPSILAPVPESSAISGVTQVWSWTFPGAPICINLPRAIIARLHGDVVVRTRVSAHREAAQREIGGLLFGHQRGQESILDIDDYIWISSELSPDGSYSVSAAELDRVRAERSGHASAVVGYFRTDSRDNLELRDAEIDLMAKQFAGPLDVALLICSSRPHTGGFFFWMGEGVMSPFSLMDFPLDVARLTFHDDAAPSAVTVPPVALSLPIPPPVSAPPPAADLRELETHLVSWPVLDPRTVKSSAALRPRPLELPAEHAALPMDPSDLSEAELKEAEVEAAGIKVVEIEEAPVKKGPVIEAPVKDAGLQAADRKRAALQEAALAAPSRSRGVGLKILGAFALLVGLSGAAGIIVLASRYGLPSSAGPVFKAAAKHAANYPLQLNVEAEGTGLDVRWDAQGVAVTQAREGRLTISEANKPAGVIALTPEQLAIGHLYFQSPAERLEVQLEIISKKGRHTRESVLALSSTPHPEAEAPIETSAESAARQAMPALPSPAPAASTSAPVRLRKVETIPIPNKRVDAAAPQMSERPADRPLVRRFTPPSSDTSLPAVPVIDQPAVVVPQPSSAVPLPVNTVLSAGVAPPPPPVQAAPAPAPQPIAQPTTQPITQPITQPNIQPLRVSSGLQAARLVKRVTPVYPSVAIAGRIQGVVRFAAIISKDGRIGDLRLVSGPPILAKAASDAVKQWTYRPTILNGQAVEVATGIDVNFELSK